MNQFSERISGLFGMPGPLSNRVRKHLGYFFGRSHTLRHRGTAFCCGLGTDNYHKKKYQTHSLDLERFFKNRPTAAPPKGKNSPLAQPLQLRQRHQRFERRHLVGVKGVQLVQ